ncbi:MAG: hypothetical protein IPH48_02595 [bacterium]|nr:hypothetical protein [bacterium]
MLPPQTPSRSARAARLRAAVACAAWLAGTAVPGAALALDGRVDIRTTHQEGRSGDQAIESDDRRELYSLEEMRELWGRSTFQLQYLARRDFLSGTAAGATVDNRLVVQTPSASLSWHAAGVRANLYGRANRADQDVAGVPASATTASSTAYGRRPAGARSTST